MYTGGRKKKQIIIYIYISLSSHYDKETNKKKRIYSEIIILSLFATKLYLFLIDLLVQKNVLNNNEIHDIHL